MSWEDQPRGWDAVPAAVQHSILAGWESGFGLPPVASAIYGRWWQIETWLRSLCYLEMRAKYGMEWVGRIEEQVRKRSESDQQYGHMSSPDANDQLAYMDASALLNLIEDEWAIVGGALLAKSVWPGRMDELRNLRNRIGHCRRPHSDDLARLEQMLRDLEPGALRALSAYNCLEVPSGTLGDPLVEAWVKGTHQVARRLLKHAASQYEVSFRLRYSLRPWLDPPGLGCLSGQAGVLWHALWTSRRTPIDIERLWTDYPLDRVSHLVMLTASTPSHVGISFSAVDDPGEVADAIGVCFDGILTSLDRSGDYDRQEARLKGLRQHLDSRVQVQSSWSIVDGSTVPISIFGAE